MTGGLSLVGATITSSSPNKVGDLTPVARLIGEYEVIVVPAESPDEALAEFSAQPAGKPIAIADQGGIDPHVGWCPRQGPDAPAVSSAGYSAAVLVPAVTA